MVVAPTAVHTTAGNKEMTESNKGFNRLSTSLWEILVPATMDGEELPVSYHKVWDDFVERLTGGLTILKSTKGKWVSPNGKTFHERMVPVRIACPARQIEQIAVFTAERYKQEAIFVYKVSDNCFIYRS
jgi:hypothetical protein